MSQSDRLEGLQPESSPNQEVSVNVIAEQLFRQKSTINAEPIIVREGFKVGFRMTFSGDTEFASLMLFDDNDVPFGYLTFRGGSDLLRCWKGCEEALNISGARGAQFFGDKYFGNLYRLTTQCRDRNSEDPAVVVGLDDEQVAKYRGKGYGVRLISLALELSKLLGKRFVFQEPNLRLQKIIDALTTIDPGSSDLSTQINVPYEGAKRAVYPRAL